MKRRIFIALTFSKNFQHTVIGWRKKHRTLPVRWIIGRNLHITLIPPWYVRDLKKTKKYFKKSRNGIGFVNIELRRVVFGPDAKHPRLIWAEGITPAKLLVLKKHLEKIFRVRSEFRPWRPHVTIARFRPEEFSSFPIKKLGERISWRARIHSLALMESRLSRTGADYLVLARLKLSDAR